MASDLKMEIFACIAFLDLWIKEDKAKGELDIIQIFEEEFYEVENVYEACFDCFEALNCHQTFTDIYWDESEEKKLQSLTSLSECYDYIVSACNCNGLLLCNASVFERMFATLGFVRELCMEGFNENINAIDYGHILWVMYFDEYTKEFYEEGGWHRLKEEAEPYRNIFSLLKLFGDDSEQIFLEYKASVKNYFDFKKSVQYCEYKSKQKKINVSKQWIKLRREQLGDYVPIHSSDYLDAGEMEDLRLDLKKLFGAFKEDCAFCSNKECLEIPNHHAESTTNTNDDEGIQYLSKRKGETNNTSSSQMDKNKYKNPLANNVPDSICLENESKNGNVKVNTNKTFTTSDESKSRNGRSQNEDGQIKNNKRTRIPRTSQMANSESDGNSLSTILPSKEYIDTYIDGLYLENSEKRETLITSKILSSIPTSESKRNVKITPDIRPIPLEGILSTGKVKGQIKAIDDDVLSTHRNGESGWPKQISEENLPNQKDFRPENDFIIEDERECSANVIESGFHSNYEKTYYKNTELTCASKTNKIAGVQCRNEIPKSLSSPKAFLVIDNVTKKYDEKLNTNKELDKLREEQDDSEIRSFLRMILVLGDKIGTQHVLRTLRSNEETTNSRTELNSKKRRSKKKSRNYFLVRKP